MQWRKGGAACSGGKVAQCVLCCGGKEAQCVQLRKGGSMCAVEERWHSVCSGGKEAQCVL